MFRPTHSQRPTASPLPPFRTRFAVALCLALLALGFPAAAKPPANHVVVFADSGDPSLAPVQHARAQCPPGMGVVSGGYALSNTGIEDFLLLANHPSQEYSVQEEGQDPVHVEDGWLVSVARNDGIAQNWGVLAFAACVSAK